jgi:hypothetical protein
MVRSFMKMHKTHIRALDGEIGTLKDVYFDDRSWKVTYFVIELGPWFSGKDVLVSPAVMSPFDSTIQVELTKAEMKACPDAGSATPVSQRERYRERVLFNLAYTAGSYTAGGLPAAAPATDITLPGSQFDPHLRSCNSVMTYKMAARDGIFGTVHDVLIDDSLWLIRFVVAAAEDSGVSQELLYGPAIIDNIETSSAVVKVALSREQALRRPAFDAVRHLDTSYESFSRELSPGSGRHPATAVL